MKTIRRNWYSASLLLKIIGLLCFQFILSNCNDNSTNTPIDGSPKNIGEIDTTFIINPSDPLSTTDSTAFLSTIPPGSTATAKIKIKAASEAVPKMYGIDTVIRYETPEGNINYSDALQAPVEVKEAGFFERLFGWI